MQYNIISRVWANYYPIIDNHWLILLLFKVHNHLADSIPIPMAYHPLYHATGSLEAYHYRSQCAWTICSIHRYKITNSTRAAGHPRHSIIHLDSACSSIHGLHCSCLTSNYLILTRVYLYEYAGHCFHCTSIPAVYPHHWCSLCCCRCATGLIYWQAPHPQLLLQDMLHTSPRTKPVFTASASKCNYCACPHFPLDSLQTCWSPWSYPPTSTGTRSMHRYFNFYYRSDRIRIICSLLPYWADPSHRSMVHTRMICNCLMRHAYYPITYLRIHLYLPSWCL